VQALVLGKILALMKGRYNGSFGDLRGPALPALRHRLILNFEAGGRGSGPTRSSPDPGGSSESSTLDAGKPLLGGAMGFDPKSLTWLPVLRDRG
jgi:hypothetical protein